MATKKGRSGRINGRTTSHAGVHVQHQRLPAPNMVESVVKTAIAQRLGLRAIHPLEIVQIIIMRDRGRLVEVARLQICKYLLHKYRIICILLILLRVEYPQRLHFKLVTGGERRERVQDQFGRLLIIKRLTLL